jgi:hypothetical protein
MAQHRGGSKEVAGSPGLIGGDLDALPSAGVRRFSSCRRNYLWGDTTSYQREPRLTHYRPALTGGFSCCGARRREEE